MDQNRRRFLAVSGAGGVLAVRPLWAQNPRPPLPTVEIGEALELFAIRNVTVIDMTGKPPAHGATVLLDGSRIARIGVPPRLTVPADVTTLDGTGKFLIPGLWDMHAHPDMRLLSLFVANGVTAVRDMQAFPNHIEVRAEIARDSRLGPQMVVGVLLDGPAKGQTGDNWRILSTAERAKAAARRARREGYDFIKIYNLLPREAYFAIMEEAREQGLPVVGHVPWAVTPAECSNAGLRSIEHTFCIQRACVDRYEEWRRAVIARQEEHSLSADFDFAPFQPSLDSFQVSRAAGLAQTMRKNKTWLCPTLIASASIARSAHKNPVDPLYKFMSRDQQVAWERTPFRPSPRSERAHEQFMETVRMLHKSGVGILAGTDVPALPYTFPGFSLHEELQLLVGAGLKPFDALKAATSGPAEFFGKPEMLGTVETGKRAELVLLDADPLADIANTRRIHAVFTGGRVYQKPALDKMLEFAETDARI